MNKDKLNNVIGVLKNVSLSEADRASLRTQLSEHINTNQPVRSPWVWESVLSPLQRFGRSAVAVAIVFFLVGGLSLAAENALPGDSLYSFKINVNEGFMSLTSSMSPTADAVHESRLANRRISELETLAARGELSEAVSIHLTTAISNHTSLARKEIAKISARGEEGNAASLETELSSALEIHSDILANITNKTSEQSSVTANAAARLRQVAQEKTTEAVSELNATNQGHQIGLENQRSQLSSVQTKRLLERTAERLTSARTQFTNEVASIESEKVKVSIENLLTASADRIDQAIDFIDEDKYKDADPLLRRALTYAYRATVLMDARPALESSGVSLDKLLDSPVFSVADSNSTSTQVGGADVISDSEVDAAEEASVMSVDKVDQASSTPSEVQGTSTETSTTTVSSSSDKKSFTRSESIDTDTDRQIKQVLERVRETLKNHSPQGFLPARTSHGEEY